MNKKPIFFIVILISIFTLSFFSSVMIYKQASLESDQEHEYNMLFYISQYEYELREVNLAISKLYYKQNENNWKNFDKWFNILWSRVDGLHKGNIKKLIAKSNFKIERIQNYLIIIDNLLYQKEYTKKNIAEAQILLNKLQLSAHSFVLKKNFDKKLIWENEKHHTFSYFKNSIIINMLTILFCLFILYVLFKQNKHLLFLQENLEKEVLLRTKKIDLANKELKKENKERLVVENKLRISYEELRQNNKLISKQANFDFLTQLTNRNLLMEICSKSLLSAKRSNKKVAFLFIDLDRFKYVNDTYGHNTGDKILIEVAQRLNEIIRDSDTAARLGGDEFAIILPDIIKVSKVEIIVKRILKELSKAYIIEQHETFLSASIGIALYPKDGESTETLLRKADAAMYKAKDNGKNTYSFFTIEMENNIQTRGKLEEGLRKALKNNEFELYYQPIIDSQSNKIISAEALIRWNHPSLGFISPDSFISLAEELGIIVEIGEWVLETACKQAVLWNSFMKNSPKVAVNISSIQFKLDNIPLLVQKVLDKSNLDSKKLTLEITESLLIDDDDKTLKQLNKIKDMNIELSIDDFGTGYSSLSYLKKFPINTLKIDRSFIMDLTKKENDKELVKAIISMAHSLKLKVVAEGVETKEQKDFIKESKCTYYQGYLYSKPIKETDFIKLLKKEENI